MNRIESARAELRAALAEERDRIVAELVGLTPDAGHTRATFGRLRTLRLIGYPTQGTVVATSMLFPEGA